MNLNLILFVAGAAVFQTLPALPHSSWFYSALLLPPLLGLRQLRPFAALLLGVLSAFGHAWIYQASLLPQELEGKDLSVVGRIADFPRRQGGAQRFEFDIEQSEWPQLIGARLRINWYRSAIAVEPGELWRLRLRLKRPRGLANPGGFDYERWLMSRRIAATGYVRGRDANRKLGEANWRYGLLRLRYRIARQIAQLTPDSAAVGLLRALAVGDRTGIGEAQWERFRRTGTNHLIAISGLHVGLVAATIFWLLQALWRRSFFLTRQLAAPRAAALGALTAAAGYAALAGFSLPTQRALIMLSLLMGALFFSRSLSLIRSLLLALAAVTLLDPFSLLSPGLWLSFGAVAVIVLAMAGRLSRPANWRQWSQVQFAVALGLLPLLIGFFAQASLIAPLVNLLLVPWFSFVLVPGLLLGVLLLLYPAAAAVWFELLAEAARLTLWLLARVAELPFAAISFSQPGVMLIVVSLVACALLMLPRGVPGSLPAVVILAGLLLNQPERPATGRFWFTLLDVGQGLAAVVETSHHLMIYDTGAAYRSGFNMADSALLPYLRSRGWQRLDLLIASNNDNDHAGGVPMVLKALTVARLLGGEVMRFPEAELCSAGMEWQWDGVSFRVLHPPVEGRDVFHGNDSSCVLQVSDDQASLLLPGDLEQKGEASLVAAYGQTLGSNILVASHHGSKTSSSQALVEVVSPEYVLFSRGAHNRYGFPHPEVVARWQQVGSQLFDTAISGAILFRPEREGVGLTPIGFRQMEPHYWSQVPRSGE
jgi:competence protein ComEC